MHDYYLDVMVKQPAVFHDLHARLLHAVHQAQTPDTPYAVSFPDWKGSKGEFGLLFRVFAISHQHLDVFKNQISKLVDHDLVRCFPVLPVPAAQKTVCFIRVQPNSKLTPSAQRRLARRGGDVEQLLANRKHSQDHFLMMRSSSGNMFPIHIRKSVTGRGSGHQYGLGIEVPDF